jgi:glycerol-3-phosphate O-acyltransferase/dihydroxyacetone phosphate acyltransferase
VLYWIIKPLSFIFLRIFYKLSYRGVEKVPYGKPIILAPNHTNAFVDPVAVGILLRQKVRFFARGDVFKGRIAKWALESMNVSPMYRIQEGYAELKKNDKTFEECRRLLDANKTLLLFPEAICVQERRLRPLKKGLARIIFQTEESFDFKKDVLVVPIGLNFSEGKRFRSKLFIDFGDPLSIKEYEERYKQDKVRAINEFTKTFEQKLAEHMLIIKDPKNDALVAGVEEIYLQQWVKSRTGDIKNLEQQYEASREIADMVNKLDEKNPEVTTLLKEKITSYIEKLKSNKLRDHLLHPDNINKMNGRTFLLDYIVIYFGMPLYAFSLLFNYPPFYIARKFSNKKIKNAEFYASVYANMAMILWVMLYITGLLIVGLAFHNWLWLGIYTVLIPLSGRYALRFYPKMKKIVGRWRLLRMVRKERDTVTELVNERAEIISHLESAKEIYNALK